MSLKIPLSLLGSVIAEVPSIETQSLTSIKITGNVCTVAGGAENVEQAVALVSHIMEEKSNVIPPRLDLCLKVDHLESAQIDLEDITGSFPTSTRFKFIEEDEKLSVLVEFSSKEERDESYHSNPLLTGTNLSFSIPSDNDLQSDNVVEGSKTSSEMNVSTNTVVEEARQQPWVRKQKMDQYGQFVSDPGRSLWVGQLPQNATEQDIADYVLKEFDHFIYERRSKGLPVSPQVLSHVAARPQQTSLPEIPDGLSVRINAEHIGEFMINTATVNKDIMPGSVSNVNVGNSLYTQDKNVNQQSPQSAFDGQQNNSHPSSKYNQQNQNTSEYSTENYEIAPCYFYQTPDGCRFLRDCKKSHIPRSYYARFVVEEVEKPEHRRHRNVIVSTGSIPLGDSKFSLQRHGVVKGCPLLPQPENTVLLLFSQSFQRDEEKSRLQTNLDGRQNIVLLGAEQDFDWLPLNSFSSKRSSIKDIDIISNNQFQNNMMNSVSKNDEKEIEIDVCMEDETDFKDVPMVPLKRKREQESEKSVNDEMVFNSSKENESGNKRWRIDEDMGAQNIPPSSSGIQTQQSSQSIFVSGSNHPVAMNVLGVNLVPYIIPSSKMGIEKSIENVINEQRQLQKQQNTVAYFEEPMCNIHIDAILESIRDTLNITPDSSILRNIIIRRAFNGAVSALSPDCFALIEFQTSADAINYSKGVDMKMKQYRTRQSNNNEGSHSSNKDRTNRNTIDKQWPFSGLLISSHCPADMPMVQPDLESLQKQSNSGNIERHNRDRGKDSNSNRERERENYRDKGRDHEKDNLKEKDNQREREQEKERQQIVENEKGRERDLLKEKENNHEKKRDKDKERIF
ncbi:MAG: hypothetical protein EZS28_018998 [Streblomastix strix]|uniref:C3H1-type domain-containing protein n=1 Tax=Streblomastix strix TaxID=222440 RepID=A0A5J4VSB8_9EUKA|nr:MAG: hypothetical protein EZS28_018998 [Streblomastix strix]